MTSKGGAISIPNMRIRMTFPRGRCVARFDFR